jgi:hypothetical protein
MSQHYFINTNGNEVMYGLSKSAGGYFWQEFTPEEEVITEKDSLSLTTLIADLESKFGINVNIQMLIDDFINERYPTILQINVGKMFNKDIVSMLKEVESDVTRNMILLQAKES